MLIESGEGTGLMKLWRPRARRTENAEGYGRCQLLRRELREMR
jgi:hypothetical protein